MAISYAVLSNEIFKIVKGMGFDIKMYNRDGAGPISSPDLAKYIYLEPDGIMISVPSDNSSEVNNEVFFYKGAEDYDREKFIKLIKRVRNVARMYGVGTTIREFGDRKINPTDFAYRAKADRELDMDDAMNESLLESFKTTLKKSLGLE
jgi:hypothetical protein